MDPFASYAALDNPQQFWAELDDILDTPFHPPTTINPSSSSSSSVYHNNDAEALLSAKRIYVASVLAKFLHLCAASFNDNLTSEYHQEYCINRLFSSTAFRDDVDNSVEESTTNIAMHQLAAEEAIRIMQTSTSIPVLLMTYEIVLQYGDAFPSTYKSIQASASTVSFVGVRAFLHRLVHQIWAGSYAAQAEAKIGISDQQQAPVGWNGAQWDHYHDSTHGGSSSKPATSYVSKGLTSSSASKDIAIQISLREKAVRMLYEVCRVQKLEPGHLKAFDERFIHHLFDLVEETRHHHDEDFNYRLIKLLVAMNEQYMVSTLTSTAPAHAATTPGQINSTPPSSARPANLVLSVLQQRLNASKTFGENLIFMLNRASSSDAEDVCMQLLVLKLLYLLFTTKETACYFYTNDLRVLVDIFIRELHDLPDESESLRHTYLRVLHPLLTNTQLCTYPYKRPQIRRLLNGLLAHGHLRDISATTKRLVDRCLRAEWCVELDRLDGTERVAKVEPIGGGETHVKVMQAGVTTEGLPMLATKIKENSNSVQATADSLAITTEDEVVSPISINTTLSPTSFSTTDSDFGSTSQDKSHSASLSVPSTLRTRDKRVASLSHPRTSSSAEEGNSPMPLLRPTSAASHSSTTATTNGRHHTRRAVSAQSAPCTPPRVDSPSSASSLLRHNSRLSELSSPPVDGDEEDAMSTSSSWHAHMLEDPPCESGKPKHPHPHPHSHSHSTTAAVSIGGHMAVVQQEAAAPRVGSPLSSESTMQILRSHVGEGSDSTIVEPVKRRKPPQPPTTASASASARRAMQLSSSEPFFSHSSASSANSRAASPGAFGGGSPANEDSQHFASQKGSGGRRRPPPPPPTAQHMAAANANVAAEAGAAVAVEAEDELASAQSFYIAERLRRGLRIR
ncbi:related to LDB17 - protein involved in the regulation of endocytosis [Ustilago trichophora]|uniref:Related to LDB17 - protein involved in the regulation of endocytosis n=1 Tax=Ustilago trichophora TaxID=86804 RepID=A0A5C3DWM7_9BASI|nr:related to LDB17 - protein involved in the regulation of endocytosis [Ustilago trichophora]